MTYGQIKAGKSSETEFGRDDTTKSLLSSRPHVGNFDYLPVLLLLHPTPFPFLFFSSLIANTIAYGILIIIGVLLVALQL